MATSLAKFTSRYFNKAVTKAASAATAAIGGYIALKYMDDPDKEGDCGSGRSAYQKFPAANDFPDLRKHNNCMATHLTEDVYKKLRDVVRISSVFEIFPVINTNILTCRGYDLWFTTILHIINIIIPRCAAYT